MVIDDKIYGKFNIDSGVLLELINSKSVQRLKRIAQYGIPDEYYGKVGFSRYDHSVGVMLLLKRLGASEEEQIAGLLHDVSHTAFSHMYDWILGDGRKEDFQDNQHSKYVGESELPKIIQKYGYNYERIVDYHHFTLLEQEIPDLCADRIDYSLRQVSPKVLSVLLPSLTVADSKIVMKDKRSALLFAENFLDLQVNFWAGFEAVSRYRIFADILSEAIKVGIVSHDDFWQDDYFVIDKLLKSNNSKLIGALNELRSSSLKYLNRSKVPAHKKFRYIDPLYLNKGKLNRLSKTDKIFADKIEAARADNEKGTYPAIIEGFTADS